MAPQIDIDRYLRRIGCAGRPSPGVEALRQLQRAHAQTFVFEGIDVLLGREVRLAPVDLEAKLVHGGRGGYCFEQNSLFLYALEGLGFEVSAVLGRSRWNRAIDDIRPRSHMGLVVHLPDGEWLADVGFGGCMMTAPVRLGAAGPETRGFEPVRVAQVGDEQQVQVLRSRGWTPVYDFTTHPQLPVDFLTPNWWMSTHPSSPFRQSLVVAKSEAARRLHLLDNRLTIHRKGGDGHQVFLDEAGLKDALAGDLGLTWDPAWEPMVAAAVSRGLERAA